MPPHKLIGDHLYMYIEDHGVSKMFCLDLMTFELGELPVTGAPPTRLVPPPIHTKVDYAFYKGDFYLCHDHTSIYRLDLSGRNRLTWGTIPCLNGEAFTNARSGIVWDHKMWVLSVNATHLWSLSFRTFRWKRHDIPTNQPHPVLTYRTCCTVKLHEGSLVVLKKDDYADFWKLDLTTRLWSKVPTIGMRPHNFRTSPCFVIDGDELYCVGGQLTGSGMVSKNHVKKLTIQTPSGEVGMGVMTKEMKLRSRIADMYQDPYCDISFSFPESGDLAKTVIRAHRSILCGQNSYFAAMFNGGFFENSTPGQSCNFVDTSIATPLCDVNPVTFEALVQFMYERLDLSATKADLSDLYKLADMYLVPELMEAIITFIETEMRGVDALNLYEAMLGDTRAPSLKLKRRAEMIITKDLNKLCKTERFASFCSENSEAMPDLTIQIASRTKVLQRQQQQQKQKSKQ